jgi:hypothetical protein
MVEDPRLFVQKCDLFQLDHVYCPDVQLCLADAQYLRDWIATGGKYNGTLCPMSMCGIWALTCREFSLAVQKLVENGLMLFRFSWRGLDADDGVDPWYKELTLRMFGLLWAIFKEVKFFKSEIAHTADETFYVICLGFKGEESKRIDALGRLRGTEGILRAAESEEDLFKAEFFPGLDVPDKVRSTILDELEKIDRMRMIGQASREWLQSKEKRKAKDAEATDTTKDSSGTESGGTSGAEKPATANGAKAQGSDEEYPMWRVRFSPRPDAVKRARNLAVPSLRRMCMSHGRVQKLWVDIRHDYVEVSYGSHWSAQQAYHRLKGQLQPWYREPYQVELRDPEGGVKHVRTEEPGNEDADAALYTKPYFAGSWPVGADGLAIPSPHLHPHDPHAHPPNMYLPDMNAGGMSPHSPELLPDMNAGRAPPRRRQRGQLNADAPAFQQGQRMNVHAQEFTPMEYTQWETQPDEMLDGGYYAVEEEGYGWGFEQGHQYYPDVQRLPAVNVPPPPPVETVLSPDQVPPPPASEPVLPRPASNLPATGASAARPPKTGLEVVGEMRERKREIAEEKKATAFLRGKVLPAKPVVPIVLPPPTNKPEEAAHAETPAARAPEGPSQEKVRYPKTIRNGTRLKDLQTMNPERGAEEHDKFVIWVAVRCCAAYFCIRFCAVLYSMSWDENYSESLW